MFTNALRFTLIGALALPLVYGQTDTARIVGIISDPSDAVIPTATVTVKNEKTGLTRKITTNERGEYLASQLPPASYDVSVEAAGMV
jgi:hypothetical protein